MKKNQNALLTNCITSNRKLKKSLLHFLSIYELSFVQLLGKMNFFVEFPLKLSGTLNNLKIIDNNGYSFMLSFFKDSVMLVQNERQYNIVFVYNVSDFSIELVEKSWNNIPASILIDSNNSLLVLKSCFEDTLSIFFDESVSLNKFTDELIILCDNSLSDTLIYGKFDITNIEKMLNSILCNHNYFIAVNFFEESA